MTQRRGRRGIGGPASQDPGKDLFAFLFIMITVFSVMMLKTAEHNIGGAERDSPHRAQAGANGLASVASDRIGRLEQRGGELVLVFGQAAYVPQRDLQRMEREGCIAVVRGDDGQEKKILYLEEDRQGGVLLGEYLEAFEKLNRAGIGVAFVEKVME